MKASSQPSSDAKGSPNNHRWQTMRVEDEGRRVAAWAWVPLKSPTGFDVRAESSTLLLNPFIPNKNVRSTDKNLDTYSVTDCNKLVVPDPNISMFAHNNM